MTDAENACSADLSDRAGAFPGKCRFQNGRSAATCLVLCRNHLMHDKHDQTPALFGLLGEAQSFGPFILDDLRISSPPRTLEVTGRAADMPNSFRTPRTESYHQTTLGALAATIAGGNGHAAAGGSDARRDRRPPRRSAPRIRHGLCNHARRTPRGGRAGGQQPLAVARARHPASRSVGRSCRRPHGPRPAARAGGRTCRRQSAPATQTPGCRVISETPTIRRAKGRP